MRSWDAEEDSPLCFPIFQLLSLCVLRALCGERLLKRRIMFEKIKVLIVDDSGLIREILKKILETDPAIQVIGMAENGERSIVLV